MASPDHPTEVGKRLRLLRFAEGYPDAEKWAKKFDLPRTTWLGYESGARTIPTDLLVRLSVDCGVTTDWILLGKWHTLPGNVRQHLEEANGALPPPRKPTRRQAANS